MRAGIQAYRQTDTQTTLITITIGLLRKYHAYPGGIGMHPTL